MTVAGDISGVTPASGPRHTVTRNDSGVLEGLDRDKHLWHGRDAAADTIRKYVREVEEVSSKGGLGMFQGVVFPCMGNILGVILFLRGPWIVGKAGIGQCLGVAAICCSCTFLTTLSLSAIATNGKIQGGGAYYLISRSLGPALGAGVGLCFYMANSIGAAMYFMGTVEAWEIAAPNMQLVGVGDLNNIRFTGYLVLAVAVLIILGGIKYVSRLGSFFLMVVLFVILCMYVGCLMGPTGAEEYAVELIRTDGSTYSKTLIFTGPSSDSFSDNWDAAWDEQQGAFPSDTTKYSFVNMMGLYFPSVTGIMAGANRSADLKSPGAYIPKGTLIAQVTTSLIYISFIFVFGSVAPRETLLNDKFFASTSAWPTKEIVIYGVIASTIGAGLSSLVSGTRLLSAIAADGTLPILKIFAAKPGREPRLAVFASAALCTCAITIGDLNAIAPLLTMFFLMCYTCVNMSCTILSCVGDPNWRPTFRYHHWGVSLVAALLCVWMMFAMAPVTAMGAMLFCGIVFTYATYNSSNMKWGDGFQGMKFQAIKNLLRSMDMYSHTKNWRPQLLLITEASVKENKATNYDPAVLRFASQLKNGRGFIMVGGICNTKVVSGRTTKISQQQVLAGQQAISKLLQDYQIEGFGKVVYTNDFSSAVSTLVQTTGIGSFTPNCILSSWPTTALEDSPLAAEKRLQMVNMIGSSVFFQKVMLLMKGKAWPEFGERLSGPIDIWWIVGDGGVLLLLPFLLAKHRVWHGCRARLFVLADTLGDDVEGMQKELDMYVRDFRLNIEVHIKVVDSVVDGTAPPPEDNIPEERQAYKALQPSDGPETSNSKKDMTFHNSLTSWRSRHQAMPSERQPSEHTTDPIGEEEAVRAESNDDMPKRKDSNFSLKGRLSRITSGSRRPTHEFPNHLKAVRGLERHHSDPAANRGLERHHSDPGPPLAASRSAAVGSKPSPPLDLPEPVGDLERQYSGESVMEEPIALFLSDPKALSSMQPCTPDELCMAEELNTLILEESRDAELVVTNLPDMPPSGSTFGYCQLVEAMTRDMKRTVLVRGTSSEVITAFA